MDGERSASVNLAKRAFFRIRQNPASPKPRVTKYLRLSSRRKKKDIWALLRGHPQTA